MLAYVAHVYDFAYVQHPVVTLCVCNASAVGLSDVLAQLLTYSPARSAAGYDMGRTQRFMIYGFIMAPVQHWWYSTLAQTFPLAVDEIHVGGESGAGMSGDWLPAMARILADQAVFAPTALLFCFVFMVPQLGLLLVLG